MKKLISLLLAVVMLISLALPAFAETEKCETFGGFKYGCYGIDVKLETDHFVLQSSLHTYTEVAGGGGGEWIKITPKEGSNLIITRIEANVSSFAGRYSQVGVTAGVKRETGNVKKNTLVHVDEINGKEFKFANGSNYAEFDKIIVYYEEGTPPTGSTISEGSVSIIVGIACLAAGFGGGYLFCKGKKNNKKTEETEE